MQREPEHEFRTSEAVARQAPRARRPSLWPGGGARSAAPSAVLHEAPHTEHNDETAKGQRRVNPPSA
eukprot:2149924-Alexandrium_andersonii.AAC.1